MRDFEVTWRDMAGGLRRLGVERGAEVKLPLE